MCDVQVHDDKTILHEQEATLRRALDQGQKPHVTLFNEVLREYDIHSAKEYSNYEPVLLDVVRRYQNIA